MNEKTKKPIDTRRLVETAIMMALAFVLSNIKIIQMPLGGTVTLASMLPIVMIAIKYDLKWGLFTSLLYGVVQLSLSFVKVIGWGMPVPETIGCLLLDYLIAYAVLGFGGIFSKKGIAGQLIGIMIALTLRFVCHYLSGTIIFGVWEDGTGAVLLHSLLYNGTYMLPELVITAAVATLLLKAPYVRKYFAPVSNV